MHMVFYIYNVLPIFFEIPEVYEDVQKEFVELSP